LTEKTSQDHSNHVRTFPEREKRRDSSPEPEGGKSCCPFCEIAGERKKESLWFEEGERFVIEDPRSAGNPALLAILCFIRGHEESNSPYSIMEIERVAGEYADRLLLPGYSVERQVGDGESHYLLRVVGRPNGEAVKSMGY